MGEGRGIYSVAMFHEKDTQMGVFFVIFFIFSAQKGYDQTDDQYHRK